MRLPNQHQRDFVNFLDGLVATENRAALAALRRGLGRDPGTVPEMHRYVVPWLPKDASRRQEDSYYLVAALFAWHQGSWVSSEAKPWETNLGASFARLLADPDASAGVERRFVALLNSHQDDLPIHLRYAIGLLKSKEIPVDWAQLLVDIQAWGSAKRTVQRDWAKAFWGENFQTDPNTSSQTPALSITSESVFADK